VAFDPLQALVDDVDRLLAAGSRSGAGDDRLRRQAATLRELGRQVPALLPIVEAVECVCRGDPAQANRALLDLVGMVGRLLLARGGNALEGVVVPLRPSGPWSNALPTSDLYRIDEAVRADESRAELLEPIAPRDLRLMPLVVRPPERWEAVADQLGLLDVWSEAGNRLALKVLPGFGPAALPHLERDLDLRQRPGAARRLSAVALIDPEAAVRICLRRFPEETGPLWLLGRLGRAAVALFVRVLANPHGNYANWNLERVATDLLVRLGAGVVPLLISVLREPDAARRATACQVLAQLGRSAAAALPELLETLHDDAAPVRAGAACALGRIGSGARSKAARDALAAAETQEQDPAVREAIRQALEKRGRKR
jgi:hypothetical protein